MSNPIHQTRSYNAAGNTLWAINTGYPGSGSVTGFDEHNRMVSNDRDLGGAAGVIRGNTVHPIEADHLGTPRIVAWGGVAIWKWDLFGSVFGDHAADENPDGDRQTFRFDLRFPGQQYDADSGLHYNYFRDYEPGTGRYVQSDPIGLAGGISTYGYAMQNPLGNFDFFGLSPTCNGYWLQVNDLFLPGWTNWTGRCRCVWLCVPCNGPYMWSGDPADPSLPRTDGQAGGFSSGGGGARFGGTGGQYSRKRGGPEPGYCICPSPSKTTPCKECDQ